MPKTGESRRIKNKKVNATSETASFIMALFIMLAVQTKAQTNPSCIIPNKMDIGFNISQYQKDFGIGLHFRSPYFFLNSIAIKVGANIQWLEHFNGTEITWTTYQNFQLGVRGRSMMVSDNIFIYGEGGAFGILPNVDFSSQSSVFGGYGLLGFEFRPFQKLAYFIELGGVGTGATADKVTGKPIYSNGFLTNVGFRLRL